MMDENRCLVKGTQAFLLEEDVLYLINKEKEYIFNDNHAKFIAELLTSSNDIEDLENTKWFRHKPQAYILKDWLVSNNFLVTQEEEVTDEQKSWFVNLTNNSFEAEPIQAISKNKSNNYKTSQVKIFGYGGYQHAGRIKIANYIKNRLEEDIGRKYIAFLGSKHESINLIVHANRVDMQSYKTDANIDERGIIVPIIYSASKIEIGPIYTSKQKKYVEILNERVKMRAGAAHVLGNQLPFVPPSCLMPREETWNAILEALNHIIEERIVNIECLEASQDLVWSIDREIIESPTINFKTHQHIQEKRIHIIKEEVSEQLLRREEVVKIKTFQKIRKELSQYDYEITKVPTINTLNRGKKKDCNIIDGGRRIKSTAKTREQIKPFVDDVTGILEKLQLTSINKLIYTYDGSKVFGRKTRAMKQTGNTSRATGFPVSASGKGRTAYQSQVSCIAEALERYSANYSILKVPERKLSYIENKNCCIHPNKIMQYSESQYRNRDEINASSIGLIHTVPKVFNENDPILWTPLINLIRPSESKFFPTSILGFNYQKNMQPGTTICCSNGLSSGNTIAEALIQGIYEVIERDSCAIWWYNKLTLKAAREPKILEDYLGNIKVEMKKLERTFQLLWLPTDFPVAVVASISHRMNGKYICLGLGCHANYAIAVSRAVTEMYQMLCREMSNIDRKVDPDGNGGIDRIVQQWLIKENVNEHQYLKASKTEFVEEESMETHNFSFIEDELHWILKEIDNKGLEIYGANYTSSSIGFPVAKVFIPGMRHFWPRYGPGRLYDVPVKLGYLKKPKSESELNQTGFFF
ncbi:YcaO-like family protein [Prochlorococcus marinus]|uniref:YcaO-like family protein n=1 Tax=Prochlorococcus marinus TaxID=1219 RepID=UPI0007B375C0|nr:YcaO-like family protein [Prochlorococcus marinus]KZR74880.1 Ribosomal protein S12 methylthiotransferase accessory factor YcaO [Prochlorococcus marinus str. MIT 1320]